MYTLYHSLAEKGFFDSNPANTQAVDADGRSIYRGPVQFPKMIYHPKGEEEITARGEKVATPFGPELLGVKKKIISKKVHSQAELDEALASGWHRFPADAIAASGKIPPPVGLGQKLVKKDEEIRRLTAMLADAGIDPADDDTAAQGRAP